MGESKEYMTHPEELGCIHISEDVLASIAVGPHGRPGGADRPGAPGGDGVPAEAGRTVGGVPHRRGDVLSLRPDAGAPPFTDA